MVFLCFCLVIVPSRCFIEIFCHVCFVSFCSFSKIILLFIHRFWLSTYEQTDDRNSESKLPTQTMLSMTYLSPRGWYIVSVVLYDRALLINLLSSLPHLSDTNCIKGRIRNLSHLYFFHQQERIPICKIVWLVERVRLIVNLFAVP